MRDLQNLQIGSRLIVPKHTPLPWQLWQDGEGSFVIHKSQYHVICQRGGYGPDKSIEGVANARLFFAAPRMLAALSLAYVALQASGERNGLAEHAAIAEGIGKLLIEATEGADG